MHTALTRTSALAAYFITVLGWLTFLCNLSTFYNENQVSSWMVLIPSSCLSDEKLSILYLDYNEKPLSQN